VVEKVQTFLFLLVLSLVRPDRTCQVIQHKTEHKNVETQMFLRCVFVCEIFFLMSSHDR